MDSDDSLLITPTDRSADFIGISFRELEYIREGRAILDGVDGWIPAAQMFAILGPSGAGKTSLLDILASRQKKTGTVGGLVLAHTRDGTVDLRTRGSNNVPVAGFQRLSGYVLQDDGHGCMPLLTVRETLEFALRLSSGTADFKLLEVEELIQKLKLGEVADTCVGSPLARGISGGELRRLFIGVSGLIRKPAVLFLDEPTTGLDATSSMQVMRLMRELCDDYKHTIVCSLHQPRSTIYSMIDQLLLLHHGDVVFSGPAKNAMAHFESQLGGSLDPYMNPADYMLDALEAAVQVEGDPEQLTANTLKRNYMQSQHWQQLQAQLKSLHESGTGELAVLSVNPYATSFCKQLQILVQRAWRAQMRDKFMVYGRVFANLLLAVIVGLMFYQNPRDADPRHIWNFCETISFTALLMLMFALPGMSRFIDERLLFWREHSNGCYSPEAYVTAITIVEFPIMLLVVLCQGGLTYALVGLRPGLEYLLWFLGIQLLVMNIGYAVCQLIAVFNNDYSVAMWIYMTFCGYSSALGGTLIGVNDMPKHMQWMPRTAVTYYSWEALLSNELAGISYGDVWLHNRFGSSERKHVDFIVLLTIFVVLRLGVYVSFRFVNIETR